MKDKTSLRVVVLFAICGVCIISAVALENRDTPMAIAESVNRDGREPQKENKAQSEARRVDLSLALDKLKRDRPSDTTTDLFAVMSWQPPPPSPPAVVSAAPVPVAPPAPPPLPFTYLGRFKEPSGKVVIYLGEGDRAHTVSQGDSLDGNYRLEAVTDEQLTLTYLPLDIKQTLSTGARP